MRITLLITASVFVVACSRTDKNGTEEPTGEATITAATAPPSASAGAGDDELIRRVEAAIASDADLSTAARNVEVDAVDGFVTLRGSVDDDAAKSQLESRVLDIAGVRTTLNKLEVREAPGTEIDDTIAFAIQRALVTDPALAPDAENVTIDVAGGVVTLRGAVSSPSARLAVERSVERKPGVVTVSNRLTVPNT